MSDIVERICTIDGCDRPHWGRGLCKKHHQAAWRRGEQMPQPPSRFRRNRRCSIDGCDRPHYGRGWCNLHYRRWYKHGDPLTVKQPRRPHRVQHGTTNEYSNFGCRCDACKKAWNAYMRAFLSVPCAAGCGATVWGRYRPGALCRKCRAETLTIPLDQCHGTELGYSKGCRCDLCRIAQNEARNRRRTANIEKSRAYDREYKKRRRRAAAA